MNFVQRHAYAVTFGVIVLVLIVILLSQNNDRNKVNQTNDQIAKARATQLQACERGNVLRQKLNATTGALETFIYEAISTRQQLAQIERKQGQLDEARINETAARRYTATAATISRAPLIDCLKAIK